jgi:FKBP-type peptidyl-prolyl cis-trans isomerase FkpA
MMNPTTRGALLVVLVTTLTAWGCGSVTPVAPDQTSVQYSQVDLVVGGGAQAVPGSNATVTYSGWLYSETAADHKGTLFGGGTFSFVVGAGSVIPGFDQGVNGMQVGGTRRLTVPPSLAYGDQGNAQAGIPANAALVFEVTLNSVQ